MTDLIILALIGTATWFIVLPSLKRLWDIEDENDRYPPPK